MEIITEQKPVIIKLSPGESLTVTSAIMVSSKIHNMDTTNKKITLRVYSDFFVVVIEENGKTSKEIFSDNWDFHIKGK